MSEFEQLQQKRDKLAGKLAAFMKSVTKTGDDGKKRYHFDEATSEHVSSELADMKGLEKSEAVSKWFIESTDELNEIAEQCETLEAGEKAAEEFAKRERTMKRLPSPGSGGSIQKGEPVSFGKQLVDHPNYKNLGNGKQETIEFPEMRILTGPEQKTTFATSAGWDPETIRQPGFVDAVTRPLQIVDIIPSIPTSRDTITWMLETTRTHSAAEIAEEGPYPEDAYVLTEQSTPVRKIGTNIPATDEQLADVPFASTYLDSRIRFGVRQRLDGQIVSGDGTGSNLEGIENVTGIQTQALGGDPVPDAFYKSMTLIRTTGRAMPTHHVMLPSDWEGIRLTRTADGIYIWGNPSEAGPERLWGLPVIQNEALSATTGMVGSFQLEWIYLAERAGVTVQSGFINDDFTDGRQRLRAQGRWALAVTRPAAFCQVTGI